MPLRRPAVIDLPLGRLNSFSVAIVNADANRILARRLHARSAAAGRAPHWLLEWRAGRYGRAILGSLLDAACRTRIRIARPVPCLPAGASLVADRHALRRCDRSARGGPVARLPLPTR